MSTKSLRIIIITLMILLFISAFLGCSANMEKNDKSYSYDSAIDEENGGFTDIKENSSVSNEEISALAGRKLIRKAEIVIETKEYEESKKSLNNLVNEFGGYIQNSNVEENTRFEGDNRRAVYTIRIPADKFDAFINKTGSIGNVISNNTNSEDISDKYFDTEARVESLKIQEGRLNELLKEASDLSDILELEKRLNEVRYEIEKLTGSLNKWDSLIELSTINIFLHEVEEITEPKPVGLGEELKSTLKGSFEALKKVGKVFLLIITALIPFLIPISIIFVIVLFIIKANNRKVKK